MQLSSRSYLRSASLSEEARHQKAYPYNLPAVQALNNLTFHSNITFFVGENGSGKSTLVEAIAVAAGFNPEGGSRNHSFSTHSSHSDLYKHLTLVKEPYKPKDGFFLRAESFYNYATADSEVNNSSLHKQSHGESFMSVLHDRFRGSGLYILDEPEASLSVRKQLELLALLHTLTSRDSQFIIATHSPILLSYPDAIVYEMNNDGIQTMKYEETEQYMMYKYFINNYERVVKEILK